MSAEHSAILAICHNAVVQALAACGADEGWEVKYGAGVGKFESVIIQRKWDANCEPLTPLPPKAALVQGAKKLPPVSWQPVQVVWDKDLQERTRESCNTENTDGKHSKRSGKRQGRAQTTQRTWAT